MIDNICVCWTALAIVLYYTFFFLLNECQVACEVLCQ